MPAFAFSMMPKMRALISPAGLGSSYPNLIMGETVDVSQIASDKVDSSLVNYVAIAFQDMQLVGRGADFYFRYYSLALGNLMLYPGVYLVVYAIFIVLPVAAIRFKMDSKMLQ